MVTIQDSAEIITTSKNHTDGVASVSEGAANIPVADWAKIINVSILEIETDCNNNALLSHIFHLLNLCLYTIDRACKFGIAPVVTRLLLIFTWRKLLFHKQHFRAYIIDKTIRTIFRSLEIFWSLLSDT